MNAREVIAKRMKAMGAIHGSRWADLIEQWLDESGFVILPRSEVEAIRDKALEEAASIANGWHPNNFTCQKIATAIRKLKSGVE